MTIDAGRPDVAAITPTIKQPECLRLVRNAMYCDVMFKHLEWREVTRYIAALERRARVAERALEITCSGHHCQKCINHHPVYASQCGLAMSSYTALASGHCKTGRMTYALAEANEEGASDE